MKRGKNEEEGVKNSYFRDKQPSAVWSHDKL